MSPAQRAMMKVMLSTLLLLGCQSDAPLSDVLVTSGSLPAATPHLLEFDGPDAAPGATLESAQALGLSDEELAYLSLLFSRAGLDFDLSQIPIDTDGDAYPNVVDNDIDGDGVPNDRDDDIDGDGTLNANDDDIDGDGVDNDDDDDIDSDGIENDDDPDADSDGLSDRWDLDDDSDGTSDDDDEDDMDDEAKSSLEDLVDAVANRGWLNEFERQQIALELARRFDDLDDADEIAAILRRAEFLNGLGGRPAPAEGHPRGINAVDEVYKQLAGAIEDAKTGQFNPDGPIANAARLQNALRDFKSRANAVVTTAELFEIVRLGEIADGVEQLGEGLGGDRLGEFVAGMRDAVPADKLGMGDTETKELSLLVKGGSRVGDSFDDEDAENILTGISRLRSLVADNPDDDPDEAEFDRLLDRLSDIKSGASDINLEDAIDQVVAEEQPDEDDTEDDD